MLKSSIQKSPGKLKSYILNVNSTVQLAQNKTELKLFKPQKCSKPNF